MSESEESLYEPDREYNSLKISAFKHAIDISPYVHEVTIGPDAENNATKNGKQISNGGSKLYSSPTKKNVSDEESALYISPKIDNKFDKSLVIDHLLHEWEMQKKETASIMVKSMLNKMITKRSEMMTRFWHQQELEYERKAQERKNREREILRQLALGDKMAQMEQERLDAENRAHSERMRKLLEKQLESTKLFEELDKNHSQICSLYQDITNIVDLENKDVYLAILQKYDQQLTNLLTTINGLAESCKSGNISKEDVAKAEIVTNKMREIKGNIAIAYQISLKGIEEETQEPVVTNTTQVEAVQEKENHTTEDDISNCCSKSSLNHYLDLKQYLEAFEESYADLVNDNSMKKFRFDCQKAVNTPVNAISSVSGSHLKDKFDKLSKLLSGDRVQVGDSYVTCSVHPQGKAYCMNLLAKKIVRQGEQTVSSNPDAAYSLASITVALWAKFSDLGKLINAHFHRECPYLIPLFLPHSEEISSEEYYKARGYKYDESGAVEKHDKFLKRMSGIFRLNAAIWIANIPYSVKLPHPQGLLHGWRWLAAFINLEPEADITATLLFDFLSVCGSAFYKHYKGQFVKVLQYLVNDYRKKIDKIDEGGPKVRLDVFLNTIIKDGNIPPPEGVLSGKIW